jgi:hypothetical protein
VVFLAVAIVALWQWRSAQIQRNSAQSDLAASEYELGEVESEEIDVRFPDTKPVSSKS